MADLSLKFSWRMVLGAERKARRWEADESPKNLNNACKCGGWRRRILKVQCAGLMSPAFFENLVSEGWLRKLQSQEQKIDENDRFGLLLMNGRDLVGAVTIVPVDE